jgi:hypothetical protein
MPAISVAGYRVRHAAGDRSRLQTRVLATCGICPSNVAFENTFLRFSRLADSPDVG